MKAITLHQPWASLCVIPRPDRVALTPTGRMRGDLYEYDGAPVPFKTIETRSWPAPKSLIGQRIAIHAAKRRPEVVNFGGGTLVASPRGHRRVVLGSPVSHQRNLFTPDGASHDLPLGAVVGTAVLAACVPMVAEFPTSTEERGDEVLIVSEFGLRIYRAQWDGPHLNWRWVSDRNDQRPFGHFEPGRWAWLLTDAERFAEPIPATGRQGIWNWGES